MTGILHTFFMALSGFLVARAMRLDEVDNLTLLLAACFGFSIATVLAGLARSPEVKP